MRHVLLFLTLAAPFSGIADAQAPSIADYRTDLARGGSLADSLCADCHATTTTGESPRPEAPPFRTLLNKFDANNLSRNLKAGVAMAHPDSPRVHLTDRSAEDLVAYLETIRQR